MELNELLHKYITTKVIDCYLSCSARVAKRYYTFGEVVFSCRSLNDLLFSLLWKWTSEWVKVSL